jgi:hypothetical protein
MGHFFNILVVLKSQFYYSSFGAEALAKTNWLYDDGSDKKLDETAEEPKRPMATSKGGSGMAKEHRVKEKNKPKIATKMEPIIRIPDKFDAVITSGKAQSTSFPPPSAEWDEFDQKHLLLINDKAREKIWKLQISHFYQNSR